MATDKQMKFHAAMMRHLRDCLKKQSFKETDATTVKALAYARRLVDDPQLRDNIGKGLHGEFSIEKDMTYVERALKECHGTADTQQPAVPAPAAEGEPACASEEDWDLPGAATPEEELLWANQTGGLEVTEDETLKGRPAPDPGEEARAVAEFTDHLAAFSKLTLGDLRAAADRGALPGIIQHRAVGSLSDEQWEQLAKLMVECGYAYYFSPYKGEVITDAVGTTPSFDRLTTNPEWLRPPRAR